MAESSGPTFTVQAVATLMGAPYSRVTRWIEQGALEATGERKRGSPRGVTPAALLAFIRQRGGDYDAEAITDAPLQSEAKKYQRTALDVLHQLLAKPAGAEGKPPLATVTVASPVNGATRPNCPKCGARMIRAEKEDGRGQEWTCLSCGERMPVKVPA